MFVYNVKFNSKNIVKIFLIIIALIVAFFFISSTYRMVSESFKVKDHVTSPVIQTLTCENYTNILKSVHDNPDEYYR